MSRTHQQVPDARTAVRPPSDLRRLWRTLLAVVAPLPMLSMGLWYVLSPVDGDASFGRWLQQRGNRALRLERGATGTSTAARCM